MIQRISSARRGEKGFTLIELLVVIAILGILAGVVVFATRGIQDKGHAAAYAEDARTLRTAQEVFCGRFGQYGTERQLAGLDNAPDGNKYKFIAEPSSYHAVTLKSGGPCTAAGAAGAAASGFDITCNVAETGCGAGGALATGGTLVVGESFASNATTNVASSTGGGTHAWWEIMYNGLIALDEAGNPEPELATVVPTVGNGGITNGGATYTLNIRPNVKWHDHTESTPHLLKPSDVKFTFEKVLLKYHARARNMAGPIGYNATTCVASNIIADDTAMTVTFNFTDPYIPFLKQLNVTEAAMNPANGIPGFTTGCPSQAQADAIKVGTGPFKFDSINSPQSGDGRVVKFASYWKSSTLPYFDAILMRPFADDTPRYTALTNGDVDWIWDVPTSKVAELSANPSFRTASTQSLGGGPNSVDTLVFNLKASGSSIASVADGSAPPHPILGDLNVRKAIFHAINRDEFLNTGRNGVGKVAKAPISSEIFGHATDISLPAFSITTADSLLDNAGWNGTRTAVGTTPNIRTAQGHPTIADGTALTIRFLYTNTSLSDRAAVLKSNLAAVGIDLALTLTTPSAATTQVFTNRNFDTYIVNYAHGYDPHVGVRRQYHTDQISTAGTPNNAAGYRNSSVDTAFDMAVKTLDPTARFNHYHDFQVQVAQDLPYVWLIETPNVRGFTAQCSGFKAYTGLFAEGASCRR